jgi:beta-lactam-binding protein with PASTA domain
LFVNILFGIFLTLLSVVLFFLMLGWITNHGNYETVPNITGKHIDVAKQMLEAKGFIVEVSDSVFDISQPKLNVIKQAPNGDAVVKKGRTIYLTVNRLVAPKVEMPNLVGLSFKSAMLYLEGLGLKLGDTSYVPDFGKNAIIKQLFNGQDVKQGTKIPIGSSISFVLGSGLGEEIEVPNLIGLTYTDAVSLLGTYKLSTGTPLLDIDVKDTAKAYVIKQDPAPFFEPLPGQRVKTKTRVGAMIDIWLGVNQPPRDSLAAPINDTILH